MFCTSRIPNFYGTKVRSLSCLVSHWVSQCNASCETWLMWLRFRTWVVTVVSWNSKSFYIDLLKLTKPSLLLTCTRWLALGPQQSWKTRFIGSAVPLPEKNAKMAKNLDTNWEWRMFCSLHIVSCCTKWRTNACFCLWKPTMCLAWIRHITQKG